LDNCPQIVHVGSLTFGCLERFGNGLVIHVEVEPIRPATGNRADFRPVGLGRR